MHHSISRYINLFQKGRSYNMATNNQNSILNDFNEKLKTHNINYDELLYNIDKLQYFRSSAFIKFDKDEGYDSDNIDINGMNTYNAIRKLYREFYDLRSTGNIDYNLTKVLKILGKETHPISNTEIDINYLNDFSISTVFTPIKDSNFKTYITSSFAKDMFAFTDKGYYKNFRNDRINHFMNAENYSNRKKQYTTNFFTYRYRLSPLLNSFYLKDSNSKYPKLLDADYFMEKGLYVDLFRNQKFIDKGNQVCIPMWQTVIDTSCKRKEFYEEDDNYLGIIEEEYKNKEWLFNDKYTTDLLYTIQNPSEFFILRTQTTHKDKLEYNEIQLTEEETRGHLFYDTLNDVLIDQLKEHSSFPEKAVTALNTMFTNPKFRTVEELDSIPIDMYLANSELPVYKKHKKDDMEAAKNTMGEKLINEYRSIYDKVFAQLFRILPYILSPSYTYDIQSPSMSIFFTALSILLIKELKSTAIDKYEVLIKRFSAIIDNIDKINSKERQILFNEVFTDEFILDKFSNYLETILPILITNTSAFNAGQTPREDIAEEVKTDLFGSNDIYSFIEFKNNITETDKDVKYAFLSKVVITLAEFFKKIDSIRVFDASTFAIDYTLLKEPEVKEIIRMFSDALVESSYIHMNILGCEDFFNGKAPKNIYRNNNNIIFEDLIELDTTRVAKLNNTIYKESHSIKDNEVDRLNSYNSYLSTINIFVSYAYCCRITIDNLTVNNYNSAPYSHSQLKHPQSLFTITKRYILHMMYMNNNSYGIFNNVTISNTNKVDIQSIMASQRIKWLTYGLHLRIWFIDNYFFYTNYKKVCEVSNKNCIVAAKIVSDLYNEYTVTKPTILFASITNRLQIVLPNVNMTVMPMAGSYTILSVSNCFNKYIKNKTLTEYISTNSIQYAYKDIMIGDSISSIFGKRLKLMSNLITSNKRISFNNINNRMQRVINDIDPKCYEIALASHINVIFENLLIPFLTNKSNSYIFDILKSSYSEYKGVNIYEDDLNTKDYKLEHIVKYPFHTTFAMRMIENILLNETATNLYKCVITRFMSYYYIYIITNRLNSNRYNDRYEHISNHIKFRGISLSNMIFNNKYSNGLSIMNKDPLKYNIFKYSMYNIFLGSNKYRLSNSLINSKHSFTSLEDNVSNSYGGSLYAYYESPMALAIYNQLQIDITGITTPSFNNLFNIGIMLLGYTHSINRRLITDLNFKGEPIDKLVKLLDKEEYIKTHTIKNDKLYRFNPDNYSYDEVKKKFVEESFQYLLMSTDKEVKFNNVFSNIDDIYNFATITSQFMDYDDVSMRLYAIEVLYKNCNINEVEQTNTTFYNNWLSYHGTNNYNQYTKYCSLMNETPNQLNTIIDTINNRKQGTINNNDDVIIEAPIITKEKDELEVIKSNNNDDNNSINTIENKRVSTYITMEAIGVTPEEYNTMKESERIDYDNQIAEAKRLAEISDKEYLDKVTKLEVELSQLRRAKKIKDGISVLDIDISNPDSKLTVEKKEDYLLLSKGGEAGMSMAILNRLNDISSILNNINETLMDIKHDRLSTHAELMNKLNDIESNIAHNNDEDSNSEEDGESDLSDIIDDNDNKVISTLVVIDKELEGLYDKVSKQCSHIKLKPYNVPKELIRPSNKKRKFIEPILTEDSITLFNAIGDKYNISFNTPLKEFNDETCNDYHSKFKIELSKLTEEYSTEPYIVGNSDNDKLLDSQYYIPAKYVLLLAPYIPGNNVNHKFIEDNPYNYLIKLMRDRINTKEILSEYKMIDIKKSVSMGIPVYLPVWKKMILPFSNIPISFDQTIDNVIADIYEGLVNNNIKYEGYKLIRLIQSFDILRYEWNTPIPLEGRIDLLMNLYSMFREQD